MEGIGQIISNINAIEAIVTNEAYRKLLGKLNFEAANAYPMSKITSLYVETFKEIQLSKNKVSAQFETTLS